MHAGSFYSQYPVMPFLLVHALGFRAKFLLIAALAALAVAISISQWVVRRVSVIQATRAQVGALQGVGLARGYLQALLSDASLRNAQALQETVQSARLLEGLAENMRDSIGRFKLAVGRLAIPSDGKIDLF